MGCEFNDGKNELKGFLKRFYEEEGVVDYQAEFYSPGNFFAHRIKGLILKYVKYFGSKKSHQCSLEIGCAEGLYSREIANLGSKAIGIDLSFPKIKRGKDYSSRLHDIFLLVADAEDLPFRPDTFDLLVFVEVLEHLPNPEKAFQGINLVLKDNGILVCSIPTGKDRFHPIKNIGSNHITKDGHLHEFSKKELREKLSRYNFEIEVEKTVDVFGEIRNFLKRKLRRRGEKSSSEEREFSDIIDEEKRSASLARRFWNLAWYIIDMSASYIPIIRKKGRFVIYVARKRGTNVKNNEMACKF